MVGDPKNSKDMPHILVVDDDDRIRDLLNQFLKKNNFLVAKAAQTSEAEEILNILEFDLVVLDIMMPGEDGVTFARRLKQETKFDTPFIFLTAKAEIEDRLYGLMSGADDYITKPFEPRELLLRVQAILRRTQKDITPEDQIKIGHWYYDPMTATLTSGEQNVLLTSVEKKLIGFLIENANKAVSRLNIATHLGLGGNERGVDVQITRIRKKIEQDPRKPKWLQTIRGEGYLLLVG